MAEYTHKIVSMERRETSNSKSPMWACLTADGERVNVFQHADPAKDNFRLFHAAGYAECMDPMDMGEVLTWHEFPVDVGMRKDGKWWSIAAVAERPSYAEPDAQYGPDVKYWRNLAQMRAFRALAEEDAVVIDVETTGLGATDEIVQIAGLMIVDGLVYDDDGETMLDIDPDNIHDGEWVIDPTLVRPADPAKLTRPGKWGKSAADVTGITPDTVANAPMWHEICGDIDSAIDETVWVMYNAEFDCAQIWRAFERCGHTPVYPRALVDVMELFAMYACEWDTVNCRFKNHKLAAAAEWFGITYDRPHDAGADVIVTLEVLKAMAAGRGPADLPF